jgi:hypothetical protein
VQATGEGPGGGGRQRGPEPMQHQWQALLQQSGHLAMLQSRALLEMFRSLVQGGSPDPSPTPALSKHQLYERRLREQHPEKAAGRKEASRLRAQARRDKISRAATAAAVLPVVEAEPTCEDQFKDRVEYPPWLLQEVVWREDWPASFSKRLRQSNFNALSPSKTQRSSLKNQCIIKIKNESGQCVGTGQYSEVREGQICPTTIHHQSINEDANNRFAMKTMLRQSAGRQKRKKAAPAPGLGRELLVINELNRKAAECGGDAELAKAGVRFSKVHVKATEMLGGVAGDHLFLELFQGTTNSATIYNQNLSELHRFCHQALTLLNVFHRVNFVHSDVSLSNFIFNQPMGILSLVDMQGSYFIAGTNEDAGDCLFNRNGAGANGSDGFRAPCQAATHALSAPKDPFSVDMFAFGMCVLQMLHRGVEPECCEGHQAGQKAVDSHHKTVSRMLATEESWGKAVLKMCWWFNRDIRSADSKWFLDSESAVFRMLRIALSMAGGASDCLAALGGLGSEPLVAEIFVLHDILVPGKIVRVGRRNIKMHKVCVKWLGDEFGWSVFANESIPPGGGVCEYGGEVRMPAVT